MKLDQSKLLKYGDQVRLSPLAKARGIAKRHHDHIGTISNEPRPYTECVSVKWPDCKGGQSYHRDFLEKVQP